MAADHLAPAGAVEPAGLGDIVGDIPEFGIESGGRQIVLHPLAASLLDRIRVEQKPVRLQHPGRFTEEAGAVAIVVRRLDVYDDVEAGILKRQLERAALNEAKMLALAIGPLAEGDCGVRHVEPCRVDFGSR